MPEFDPYHKWFGIKPEEQPPNHYRLLGVDVFEVDADVIDSAAEQRMTFLQNCATGPQVTASQKLLNEVSAARVCLLNPQKKAAYDQKLRELLKKKSATTKASPPQSAQAERHEPVPLIDTSHSQSTVRTIVKRSRRSRMINTVIVLVSCVIGAFAVYKLIPRIGNAVTPLDQIREPIRIKRNGKKGTASPTKTSTVKSPDAGVGSKGDAKKSGSVNKGRDHKLAKVQDVDKQPDPNDGGPAPQPPRVAVPKLLLPDRQPVPEPDAQQKAELAIRKLFGEEIAKAKKVKDQVALAKKFYDESLKNVDDPAARYVLLREARDLAVDIGHAASVMQAVDQMALTYQFDAVDMKADMLKRVAVKAKGPALQAMLARNGIVLIDEVLAQDKHELADEIARLAASAAAKSRLGPLRIETKQVREQIATEKAKWESLRKAWSVLKSSPDDPRANELVGKHHCFTENDWEQGLTYLAKTGDARLKGIVKLELSEPADADKRIELAEAWADYAKVVGGESDQANYWRAVHWYRRALPFLSGLARAGIEQKIEDVVRSAPPPSSLPHGAVLIFTFNKSSLQTRGGGAFVKDLSGYDNHGVIRGTRPVKGIAAGALSFDGKDDYVECAKSETLSLLTKSMTLSAWCKARAWQFGYLISNENWGRSGTYGYLLRVPGGVADMTMGFPGRSGWRYTKSSVTLDLDRWYHVASTFDGEVGRIYVNGEEMGSGAHRGLIQPSTMKLRIGRSTSARQRLFNGIIDEVAIFCRALPAAEIQALFQMGLTGKSLAR